MTTPKMFISYSWTTPDHEAWVEKLAGDLVTSGVDVILDKWDLLDGNDTHAFMEKANDPSVTKVAMICDRAYVRKANGRTGGVGIEAQIITPGVYTAHDQTKYVAVVVETDEEGRACVPTYYGSKKYIDFTDFANEPESFDKLLRWIFDKPMYVKPKLGTPPSFLDDDASIKLATGPAYRRALDAVKSAKPFAEAAISEYFDLFTSELEAFRYSQKPGDTDEVFVASIESYTPYRNEAVGLFNAIALYLDNENTRNLIALMLERLIPYMYMPANLRQCYETDFDNFKFITHELFLYAVACYLKHERFAAAKDLLDRSYYTGRIAMLNDNSVSYDHFYQHIKILEIRKQRLKLNRMSLHADMLHDRNSGLPIDFQAVMDADFIMFLRHNLRAPQEFGWYPVTLIYMSRFYRALPIFARAKSKAFFDRVRSLLGVASVEDFKDKIVAIRRDVLPSGASGSIKALTNFDEIGTS